MLELAGQRRLRSAPGGPMARPALESPLPEAETVSSSWESREIGRAKEARARSGHITGISADGSSAASLQLIDGKRLILSCTFLTGALFLTGAVIWSRRLQPASRRFIRLILLNLLRTIIRRTGACARDRGWSHDRGWPVRGLRTSRCISCPMEEAPAAFLGRSTGDSVGRAVLAGCRKANPALLDVEPAVTAAASLFLPAPTTLHSCRSLPQLPSPHCRSPGSRDGANRALAKWSQQVCSTERLNNETSDRGRLGHHNVVAGDR